ncbi:mechanosensitive ion channel family protein [Parasphingopyxis sp.]|uniref:mechanosensitive ion channel family protein n=1 Tax=Parasphingopyxis sp. TaxID=1920299 RepID=UPI00263354E3|nr:mechanosensitive ion channel family protein [Parasphingopyxis sp.]
MNAEADRIILEPIELIQSKTEAIVDGFYFQLPNIIAAILLLVFAWLFGKLLARVVRMFAERRDRPDLGALLGSLAKVILYLLALLAAAAIVFPTVNPGDILAMLGIGSVAIGFAFKDILQNLLAGLLLLIRRPYLRGDHIIVDGYEGEVEHIESRATVIRTYDGRRVIIPNSDVYTSPVTVNTAHSERRDEVDIGIGYGDEPRAARAAFLAAIANVPGVLTDPPPQVIPWALGDSTIDLKARWWTDWRHSHMGRVRADVLLAIFETAKAKGIDLPFPTQVMLFHDQTEESDGDRTRQREGWPPGHNPPAPRWIKMRDDKDADETR